MDVPIRWYGCSYSSVLLSIVKVAGRMEKHWRKKYNMKHWSSNEFRTGCRSAHHFHYNSIHLGASANNHFQSSFEVTRFFSLVPGACFPIIGHLHVGVISLLRPQSFSFFLSYLNWESQRALNHKSPNLNKKANPSRFCHLLIVVKWHYRSNGLFSSGPKSCCLLHSKSNFQ